MTCTQHLVYLMETRHTDYYKYFTLRVPLSRNLPADGYSALFWEHKESLGNALIRLGFEPHPAMYTQKNPKAKCV